MYADTRMLGAERRQTRHEPLRGETRRRTNVELIGLAGRDDLRRRLAHPLECLADFGSIAPAGVGQGNRPPYTIEQIDAQRLLKTLDLMADRGRR